LMPEASTESHITDPPIPSVADGAVVPNCMAGESTAEALSRSPSPYSGNTDEDVPFPHDQGCFARPSSERRSGGAPRSTSLHLRQPKEVRPVRQESSQVAYCHVTHVHH
jgi:hypothetical protein